MIDEPKNTSDFDVLNELVERQKILDEHAIVVTTDVDGNITFVNDKFVEISGYSREELIGKNHRMINSGMHEPEFFEHLWQTISGGNVWKGEIQNRAKDGSSYWVESTIAPIKNELGEITKYIAMRTDVTRRKKMEAELLRTQKHEAIGRVTASITHDFNNLLGIVIGSFEVLGKRDISDEKAKVWIDTGLCGAKRAAAIIQQMARYSQEHIRDAECHPFHKTVSDYVEFLLASLLSDIPVITSYAEDLSGLCFSKKELEESILELARNATEAIGENGNIEFRTQNLSLDKQTTWSNLTLDPGHYVMLELTDDGAGISPDIANEIFDPFFTTKEFGSGKGLGLSNVHGFVRQHHGHLGFLSDQNKKTIFRLYLPINENCSLPESHA